MGSLKIGAASRALLLLILLDVSSAADVRASGEPLRAFAKPPTVGCHLIVRRSSEAAPPSHAYGARAAAYPRLPMTPTKRSHVRGVSIVAAASSSSSWSPNDAGLLGLEDMRRFTEANGVGAEYVSVKRRPDAEMGALTAKATAGNVILK